MSWGGGEPGLLACTVPVAAAAAPAADAHPPRFHVRAGLAWLDGLLHHLLTPAFIVPQALNLCGSVLFAATLGSTNISLAAPVANGEAGTGCVSLSGCTA